MNTFLRSVFPFLLLSCSQVLAQSDFQAGHSKEWYVCQAILLEWVAENETAEAMEYWRGVIERAGELLGEEEVADIVSDLPHREAVIRLSRSLETVVWPERLRRIHPGESVDPPRVATTIDFKVMNGVVAESDSVRLQILVEAYERKISVGPEVVLEDDIVFVYQLVSEDPENRVYAGWPSAQVAPDFAFSLPPGTYTIKMRTDAFRPDDPVRYVFAEVEVVPDPEQKLDD